MGLKWQPRWPFSRERKKKGPKTVSIFLGFFFMVNYCLGTGFLGVPFSFFYAGYLASIPTLLLIAFVSWNNAEWEVETMARAQAIDSWRRDKLRREGQLQSESESEQESLITDGSKDDQDSGNHPRYEIRLTRKFEPIELCEIFLTQWGKYSYMVIWSINCFLTSWSFTTVAGSAWSTNIPFSGSSLQQCRAEDFLGVLIPENSQCRNAYMLCVLLFAVIVIPLSLLDLKEQAFLHMVLGLLRFATIGLILLYAIVKLGLGTNECTFTVKGNSSLFLDHNASEFDSFSEPENATWITKFGFSDLSRIVFRFDLKGWLVSIPVLAFAIMLHQAIPSLTHPIREKHLLREFMVAMFGAATLSYLSLGVVVPLWFKANIQETCTLNWVPLLTDSSVNWSVRILSYYLVLFPSIDVISAYPLTIHAISNNIFMIICGRDTSRKSKHPTRDCILQFTIKFLSASLPIVAGLFVSNLIYILKYAGLTGFFICFLYPTALQLRSSWVCSKAFESHSVTVEMKKIGEVPALKGDVEKPETSGSSEKRNWSFSSLRKSLSRLFASYQTPYSNRFLSHPIVVSVLGVVGVVLLLLGIASLAVHPEQIFCSDEP